VLDALIGIKIGEKKNRETEGDLEESCDKEK
jgi:hypothetical protein